MIDKYASDKADFSHGLYYFPEVWDKNDRLLEADKFVKYSAYMLVLMMLISMLVFTVYCICIWGIMQAVDIDLSFNTEATLCGIVGIVMGWVIGVSITVAKYKALVKAVSP